MRHYVFMLTETSMSRIGVVIITFFYR